MGDATPWVIGATQVAILAAFYFRLDHRLSAVEKRIGALEQRVAKLEGLIEGNFGARKHA